MITEVRKDGRLIAVYQEKIDDQKMKQLRKAGYKIKFVPERTMSINGIEEKKG